MRQWLIAVTTTLLAGLFLPGVAAAANGYATGNVNMRTGPGTEYQRVATIPNGAAVNIIGCLNGYNWCDVSWRGTRGWVSGSYLQAVYRNRRRPIVQIGPRINLRIITGNRPNRPNRPVRPRPPRPGKPSACTQQYQPVCARRGGRQRTFSNSCVARQAGFTRMRPGTC